MASALSWMGYPVTTLFSIAVQEGDFSWLWPAAVTAAWVVAAVLVATTRAHRHLGLGLLVGLAFGFVTCALLFVVSLVLLAEEIGYS